jgi:hypothetical protein
MNTFELDSTVLYLDGVRRLPWPLLPAEEQAAIAEADGHYRLAYEHHMRAAAEGAS